MLYTHHLPTTTWIAVLLCRILNLFLVRALWYSCYNNKYSYRPTLLYLSVHNAMTKWLYMYVPFVYDSIYIYLPFVYDSIYISSLIVLIPRGIMK